MDGTVWIIAGLLACGAEMLLPGVFLLPVGAAAVLTGAGVRWFGVGGGGEWLLFSASMIVFVLMAWRVRRRPADRLNGPQAGLVGTTCYSLGFLGAEGRVSLGDGAWTARLAGGLIAVESGAALRVIGLDGTTLLVSPVESPETVGAA